MNAIRQFWNDERSHRGHRLIEYALLFALAALGSSEIVAKTQGDVNRSPVMSAALRGE